MNKKTSEGSLKSIYTPFKPVLTVLFTCFFVYMIFLAFTADAETIDGRMVYVDNSRLYFEANPHTIQTGDDIINFEFISKQFSGNIDIAFGFDTDIIKPKSAEILRNGEWDDVTSAFNKVTYNYQGMDSWYYTQGFNVNTAQNYNLRVGFDVLSKGSGKYWVCAKPSSQSIIEAIQSDNFLCLDPWFNVSFVNKNAIFANASVSSDTTTLIPVNITLGLSLELFWCNFTVNATNATVGFVYWNNETDYICVNKEETSQVLISIDEGNGSNSGSPEPSLIGWWTLNKTGEQQDKSLYKRNLSETADPVSVIGKIGNGIDFQTDDKYTGSTFDFDGMAEATWGWWMNTDDNSADPVIFSKFDTAQNSYFCQHMNDDKLACQLIDQGGDTLSLGAGMSAIPKNKLSHVVVNYNSTCLLVYVNGVLNFTSPCESADTVKTTNSFLRLGAYSGGLFYDGTLDNVMIWNRSLSPDEISVLYDTVVPTLPDVAPTETLDVLNINFISQIPTDITSTNLMNETANITYNITGADLNLSTIRLETVINSSSGISYINVNGISSPMNVSFNFTSNVTIDFTTILEDDNIYPASYAIDDETMENSVHSIFTASNDNNLIKTTLLNISNSTRFSLLEIMTNSSTGVCDIFYCNSSYTTGSVTTNNNCGGFGEIPPNTPFNHTHPGSGRSAHIFIPLGLDITDGTISGVQVTPESQIIVRGSGCNTFYINNNTATAQTSVNNGATWTSQAWTIDAHIHQFNDDEVLYYRQCANDTSSVKTCSDLRFDNLDITPLPPSAPFIITPQEGTVQDDVEITYEECISPIGNLINYYNISLLYTNLTFFDSISVNNSLNLNFTWDSELVVDDDYIIEVNCVDNTTLNTSAFSGTITVLNNVTIIIPVSASFCSSDTIFYTRTVEIETNVLTGLQNVTSDETFTLCPNGCGNFTLIRLGEAGCIENDFMLAVLLIISSIVAVLLIRGVFK